MAGSLVTALPTEILLDKKPVPHDRVASGDGKPQALRPFSSVCNGNNTYRPIDDTSPEKNNERQSLEKNNETGGTGPTCQNARSMGIEVRGMSTFGAHTNSFGVANMPASTARYRRNDSMTVFDSCSN